MKKYAALFLATVFSIVFAACNSGTPASSSKPGPKSSETVSSEAKFSSPEASDGLQIDNSQLDNLGKPKHLMNFTTDDLIKAIDSCLDASDEKLSKQIPHIEDYKSDAMGNVDEDQYDMGNGILLSLYNSKENNKVAKIEFFIYTSETSKESIQHYAKCVDATIKYLDKTNASKIEQTLALNNIETNQSKFVETDQYSFSYFVQDGTDVLMIRPAGQTY